MTSVHLSPRVVAAISLLLGIPAAFSQEILTIEDQGAPREFELVEDEVLLTGQTENGDRLRQDVEVAIQGAKVLETRGREALAKLDKRIDRRRAAARLEPMQQAAPEYQSEPVLYPKGAIRTVHSRRYVGPRVLAPLAEGQTLEQLRAQTGAVQVKKAPLAGHAILTFTDGWKSLSASEALAGQGIKARPLLRRYVEKMFAPNDSYYLDQWHLKNRGQGGGVLGIDANINTAWDTALGAGVTVVVVDDSLQTTHPDFELNVPPVSSGLHRDFRNDDADPAPTAFDDAHGTSVGGVIGARGNNNLGVSGAAPQAQLLGVRLIGGFFDADTAYEALNWQPPGVTSSVSNNSWGYGGVGMISLDPLERQALQDAATQKRGGLGQITLFAAANNDEVFNGFANGEPVFTSQDANYQPYANSRFVIGVGAVTNFGDHSYYSNRGASVLISAPSNGGSLGIFTTDNVGTSGYNSALDPAGQPSDRNYTNSFGGTSSATPLTSGVVALMLSANPGLGYRDVQEILATTARKIDGQNPDWVTNGAGFHFAHAYGAGMVDATAAVLRAKQWTNLAPVQTYSRTAVNLPAQIIDASPTPVSRSFDFSTSPNLRLEHVEVVIQATHGNRSDLEIVLTSPSGTQSILNPIRPRPSDLYTGDNDNNIGNPITGGWVYMTTHNWGENSSGTWTLTARDDRSGSEGTLDSAQVRIYGTPAPTQRVRFTQQQVITSETPTTVNLSVERLGETATTVTVGYAVVGGSATNGADYTLANGTVTFGPGESQKDVAVSILDDDLSEASESIYVILTEPTGARLGGNSLCSILISASDGNLVSITTPDRDAAETAESLPGNPIPKQPGTFRISRLVADENPLIVPIVVSGTATFGVDYETIPPNPSVPTSVTIPGGTDSVLITIMPRFDETTEGVEYVTITLAPPDPAAEYELGEPSEATVVLADDELEAVSIIVEQNQTQLPETGAQTANLVVARDGGASTELNVGLLVGGSAQPGIDYIELPDSVSFAVGESQKVLTVTPKDNDFFNPTRTIAVAIAPGSEYHQGFNKSVTIQIGNDEPVPDPTKPTVTITAPTSNQRISPPPTAENPLVATGTAKDNLKVARVLYRINQSDWTLAVLAGEPAPTVNWTADITAAVRPGPNLFEARSEDEDGNISSVVASSFTIVQPRTLTVQVTGPGSVTPGTGVLEAGQPYKLTAKPQKGQLFAGWSGALVGSSKVLNFTMPDEDATVIATFVSNPFVEAVTGRYTGLLTGSTAAHATSGMIDIVVAKTGKFTGKVWHSGKAYPLKGEFNGSGKFDGQIKRKDQIPLTVSLSMDLNPTGTQQITGSVAGELEPSIVDAHRAPFHAKKNPLSGQIARAYTFYLPPKYPNFVEGDDMSALAPHGNGVATLNISTSGVVKWTGTLGDGTKAAQTTVINAAHRWPLYLALYKGAGYIGGAVAHDANQAESDLAASLNWVKLEIPTDRVFRQGFTIAGTWLIGANYTPPAKGQRVLTSYDNAPGNAGPLFLVEGNLNAPGIAKTLSLTTANKATILPAGEDKLRISISAKTGIVSGSFVFPVTRKVVPIKGVILQNKINKGVGVFTGTTLNNLPLQTGRLEFQAATP